MGLLQMDGKRIIRQHIRFTGRVQGVGFRWRARHAAGGLGVTGWVRNEWDGSVEMEAQGTPGQIDQMLELINQSPYICIDWIDREEIPVNESDMGFHVR